MKLPVKPCVEFGLSTSIYFGGKAHAKARFFEPVFAAGDADESTMTLKSCCGCGTTLPFLG